MNDELNTRKAQIDDYLLGKLSEEETKAFEIFLFGSPQLLQEVRLREQMIRLIKEERAELLGDNQVDIADERKNILKLILPRKKNFWLYAGAAAAILLLALLIGPNLLKDDAPADLSGFTEDPFFESQIGASYRTSDISISVLSPEVGQNFETEIFFRWEATRQGKSIEDPLELKILNNQERLVFQTAVINGQFQLTQPLRPGLYYWTIEKESEMLYLGKFFVKKP